MRYPTARLFLLAALLLLPGALRAQSFSGTGQQATGFFYLPRGLVVFDLAHRAESGPFRVRLMDEQGEVIDELANADGAFQGSRAVRVPRSARYVLDVAASGEWSIERRENGAPPPEGSSAPAYLQGEEAGEAAASRAPTGGWFARGLLGGMLAGPLGAAVAVNLAGSSGVDPAAPLPPGSPADPAFREGFQQGLQSRVRAERRKMAFVGGMVGTGVFVATLIYLLDVAGDGGGAEISPRPDPTLARVPR